MTLSQSLFVCLLVILLRYCQVSVLFKTAILKKKKSDVMTKEACKGQFRVTKICKASHSGKYCVKDKSSYFHFP